MLAGVRKHPIAALLVAVCAGAFAQTASTAHPVSMKAGGVELVLPAPSPGFAEVGDRLRTGVFELLAPSSNRLLSAYLPAQYLADARAGKIAPTMDTYAMVQVPRRAEYADCTPEAFDSVLKGLVGGGPKLDTPEVKASLDEISLRLKALGGKPIELGRPEMLGTIFQKKDAAAMAMLLSMKQGENAATMACGLAVFRVRQRLVFAYLYQKYGSPESVDWIRKNIEAWADAILAKNTP